MLITNKTVQQARAYETRPRRAPTFPTRPRLQSRPQGHSLAVGDRLGAGWVGKQVRVQIYGHKGALLYSGDDNRYDSGRLELRRRENGGKVELPDGEGFYFENTKQEGDGPESLQNFIAACNRQEYYDGAGSLLGLKTVQVIDAMYKSAQSGQAEAVAYADEAKQQKCLVNA